MRKVKHLEAYLDDYNLIHIYQSEISYGGLSDFFYLEDEDNNQIELQIESKELKDRYYLYTCTYEKDIKFGKHYEVISSHGRNVDLVFANIVKTKRFNDRYFYTGADLGLTYTKRISTFKLWAPTAYDVKLEIIQNNVKETYEMHRNAGVYSISIKQNLLHATYVFIVSVNGVINRCLDPYGKVSTLNSKRSVVVDINDIKHKNYSLPKLESNCDAIIYETSIRDITKKKTFRALSEMKSRNRGLDYLNYLGVTHIQLLPIIDFKSVDDINPSRMYNWGYDTYEWMALDNSYSSDNTKEDQILHDFNDFVDSAHNKGIRVNLDVVFNHVFDVDDSVLEKTVPNYFFQISESGVLSNSSMCGNDVDSLMPMCQKYILDSCLYLLKTFNIDGLRFDLMGILDIDTMNLIAKKCKEIKPDFMIYGEGWNMPSYLIESKRATIQNNAMMSDVAHFSDIFRDTIKGKLSDNVLECGYVLGNFNLIYNAMNSLLASVGDFGNHKVFEKTENVVNFVECHDNMTSWDQIDSSMDESEENKIKRHKMLIAFVVLAQGIPFIQGGQEFARTKHRINDSYNAPDSVNEYDYSYLKKHLDVVHFTRDVISIRKQYKCFRLSNNEDVYKDIYFDIIDGKALVYKLNNDKQHFRVIFNPSLDKLHLSLYDEEVIFYNMMLEKSEKPSTIDIEPLSVIILKSESGE